MIKVVPAPESATFDSKVRQPGLRALARKGKIRPYWTRALDDLMAAYHEICAYSCFRIHPITGARSADHFAPKPKDRDNIYEWSNYRLVCSRLNSSKRDFGDVLDPFETIKVCTSYRIGSRTVETMPAALRPARSYMRSGLS